MSAAISSTAERRRVPASAQDTPSGSAQERDAATGALIWETGLPNGVIGSPTMNGAGVLAVGTYDSMPLSLF